MSASSQPQPPASSPRERFIATVAKLSASRWLDAVLLACLLVTALLSVRVSPLFAANLQQDAVDFVMPAINYLETGQMVMTRFGQPSPPTHPIGLSILLLPCYAMLGHFPGNGIYSLLVCLLGAIVVVYLIGRKLTGPLGGFLAGAFLMVHHGVYEYSLRIMSEVPALLAIAGLFLILLYLPEQQTGRWQCLILGLVAGLAVAIRCENILLAVPVVILLWRGSVPTIISRTAWTVLGLLPWVVILAAYQQRYYGGWWRTGYQYWDSIDHEPLPLFAFRYATARGIYEARHYSAEYAATADGNFWLMLKTWLTQADLAPLFSTVSIWKTYPHRLYTALVAARTALGIAGLSWCLWNWRRLPAAKTIAVWFLSQSVLMIAFHTFLLFHEDRYLLQLAPSFCVLNALGPAVLVQSIPRWNLRFPTGLRLLVILPVVALLVSLGVYIHSDRMPQNDDVNILYDTMHSISNAMESNAVIVTDWDPFRTDLYMIKDTQRVLVPLTRVSGARFDAVDQTDNLVNLMRAGRPAYLFLQDPFVFQPTPSAAQVLASRLKVETILTATTPNGQKVGPYLCSLQLLPTPQSQ